MLNFYFKILFILFLTSCSSQNSNIKKSTPVKRNGPSGEDLSNARLKYPDPTLDTKPVNVYKAPPVKTEFDKSVAVEKLLEQRIDSFKVNPQMQGFRILIFSGQDRAEAMEFRKQFTKSLPEINSYLVYNQPYYKVKAGDFITRLEAQKIFGQIKKEFPNSIIVTDKINVK